MNPYYEDSAVTIYHGDCRDILPFLPKVDLVLTDPPYVGLEGGHSIRFDKGVGKLHEVTTTIGDIWQANFDWLPLVESLTIYGLMVFCTYHCVADIRDLIHLKPQTLITWYKRNAMPSSNNTPQHNTEFIWAFKGEVGLEWRALNSFYDIPNLSTGCMATERFVDKNGAAIHPTQKPLELMKKLLAVGGALILDPFMGSGTTLRAAKDLGRKAIGIEIEEKYCEIAAKRMSQTVMGLVTEH